MLNKNIHKSCGYFYLSLQNIYKNPHGIVERKMRKLYNEIVREE